jgi:hypothetical protein
MMFFMCSDAMAINVATGTCIGVTVLGTCTGALGHSPDPRADSDA